MSGPEYAYTVSRTVATLELLADRPRSAPEVARELRVAPKTARRMLRRLVADGYASPPAPPHHGYTATGQLALLGQRAATQIAHHAAPQP